MWKDKTMVKSDGSRVGIVALHMERTGDIYCNKNLALTAGAYSICKHR